MRCLKCDSKVLAKGLCNRHYYEAKRRSNNPKDIAAYRTRPAQLSAIKYASMTKDERLYSSRMRRKKHRKLIEDIVGKECALRDLSPCSIDRNDLCQDHSHICKCELRTGCSECFRGLLCCGHNRLILPVLEKLNEEHIPLLVKEYLANRPLKGTGVEPYAQ